MGNMCSGATSISQDQFLNFQQKNKYNNYKKQLKKQPQQKLQIIHDRIAPGQPQINYRNITSYISQQNKLYFTDIYFKYLQPFTQNTQSSNLQKLYNFQLLRLDKVYKNTHTNFGAFVQNQIQLSYLSTVFYLICQNTQLKQKIFITKHVNPHSAYIIRLFCNGEITDVVVDQFIPIVKRNIKFLNMTGPEQIWPFLLQKAWCKQIGGYDKARGLSPQDCFEQIYGMPAFSFKFRNRAAKQVFNILRQAQSRKYWIALTTVTDPGSGLGSRQVFYLERFNQSSQLFTLISPYTQSTITQKVSESTVGQIQYPLNQIYANFQYATIGAYQHNFALEYLQFTSEKDEQKIFQVDVNLGGKVNIRISQFYSQYLSSQKKQHYRYSPVLMELYNSSYEIIERCQGRVENLLGIRSSYLSDDIFVQLLPGKYFLRVQVTWQTQYHSTANIVAYAPRNILKISPINKNSLGTALDFSAKLLAETLQKQQVQKIQNSSQQILVRHIQKVYGHIIGIQNLTKQRVQLQIIFHQSQNIKINHHHLEGKQNSSSLRFELDGEKQRVLQILPKDPSKKYWLAPFDIVKV